MNDREFIISVIKQKFHANPEYLWAKTPDACVFRHRDNRKWFAIIMNVSRATMGLAGGGNVDIINVKCNNALMGSLLASPGYRPAYHMNKEHWISVILDNGVPRDEIQGLIQLSFKETAGK